MSVGSLRVVLLAASVATSLAASTPFVGAAGWPQASPARARPALELTYLDGSLLAFRSAG